MWYILPDERLQALMQTAEDMLVRTEYGLSNWRIEDYPVIHQTVGGTQERVFINGWPLMDGWGPTREAALEDLRRHLEAFAETHDALPEPGTEVPIEFAPSDIIQSYEPLARDFMLRVFGLNWDECIITDDSNLWDFDGDEDLGTVPDFQERAFAAYGVDITNVGTNIVEILEYLSRKLASD